MGVRGLPQALRPVDHLLARAVDLTRAAPDDNGRRGFIIDGDSLLYYLHGRLGLSAALHAVTGGCFRQFTDLVDDFLHRFTRVGVPLHVVFDGALPGAKRDTRIGRRRTCADVCAGIDKRLRSSRGSLAQVDVERTRVPDLCKLCLRQAIATRHPTVTVSVALFEADDECARLADATGAVGVLAQDTDYLIFAMTAGYVPFASLALDDDGTMSGKVYHAARTASVLGVPVSFLPVVANLCGNDVVSTAASPDLGALHARLHHRSATLSVAEQVVSGAKAFHRRRPTQPARAFLRHFLDTSLSDRERIAKLTALITSSGADKYATVRVVPRDDGAAALLRLHVAGRLSSPFATDVVLNRAIAVSFGVGYASWDDAERLARALRPLRRRLAHVLLNHEAEPFEVVEDPLGLPAPPSFDNVVASSTDAERPAIRALVAAADVDDPNVDLVDAFDAGRLPSTCARTLLRFVLHGDAGEVRDDDVDLDDVVFVGALRYTVSACPDARRIVDALLRTYVTLVSPATTPAVSAPPWQQTIDRLDALFPCAVFRHVLQLAMLASDVLGGPVPVPLVHRCFDGDVFHAHLRAPAPDLPGQPRYEALRIAVDR
ncbi:unnamed protein product (mitochondrion) [Plasmodiophora brassicae]|uniref:Asteroid domain-containing protein n=1 Tax=Plasmodiophora brassicae TaxID=37360 RepID=A0A3P3YA75_PLABS|nr:unnamed protein product [Plasmodiophora brassicae]